MKGILVTVNILQPFLDYSRKNPFYTCVTSKAMDQPIMPADFEHNGSLKVLSIMLA